MHGKARGNYRGIPLLSITGKFFARILRNWLQIITEKILPESQRGFPAFRGAIDIILCVRQLQEKGNEQQKTFPLLSMSYKRHFDNISRAVILKVLHRFGCPGYFISLLQARNDNMPGRVFHQNILSEKSPIPCRLKRRCVLALVLFTLYLDAMFYKPPPDNPGFDIRYRYDAGLFNLN